jgi:hypothetical protein
MIAHRDASIGGAILNRGLVQARRACAPTIPLKASSGRGTRAGGSAAGGMVVRGSISVKDSERTLLAAGEERQRSSPASASQAKTLRLSIFRYSMGLNPK